MLLLQPKSMSLNNSFLISSLLGFFVILVSVKKHASVKFGVIISASDQSFFK